MTLVEFLMARLDEERAAAQAAYDAATDYRILGPRVVEDHFAFWKPERVLADVDARRRIVVAAESAINKARQEPAYEVVAYVMLGVLAELAAVFVTHPDFDKSWRP